MSRRAILASVAMVAAAGIGGTGAKASALPVSLCADVGRSVPRLEQNHSG